MKNEKNPNMHRDALLRRALVPKGYRPTKASEIEKMLKSVDSVPMTDEKKARMLRKLAGEQPIFVERLNQGAASLSQLTPSEKEIAVLCRSKGEPLPPDLAAKIKAMEERTAKPKPTKDAGDGG